MTDKHTPRLRTLIDDRDRTAPPMIRITVEDLRTGDKEMRDLPSGDYFVLTTEPAYVDHVQTYRNGTHVLTIKGRTVLP